MKTGVSMVPWAVLSRPSRALELVSVLSNSNIAASGQVNPRAFARRIHFQTASFIGNHLPRLRHHAVDFLIVMIGVMVEEEKTFHPGFKRKLNDIIHAAMAPPAMFAVLVPVVLRVHDQQIGPFDEFRNSLILFPRILHPRG